MSQIEQFRRQFELSPDKPTATQYLRVSAREHPFCSQVLDLVETPSAANWNSLWALTDWSAIHYSMIAAIDVLLEHWPTDLRIVPERFNLKALDENGAVHPTRLQPMVKWVRHCERPSLVRYIANLTSVIGNVNSMHLNADSNASGKLWPHGLKRAEVYVFSGNQIFSEELTELEELIYHGSELDFLDLILAPWTSTLKHLTLASFGGWKCELGSVFVFPWPELRTLTIESHMFNLSTEEMAKMRETCPKLEKIKFVTGLGEESDPALLFDKLVKLQLPVDLDNFREVVHLREFPELWPYVTRMQIQGPEAIKYSLADWKQFSRLKNIDLHILGNNLERETDQIQHELLARLNEANLVHCVNSIEVNDLSLFYVNCLPEHDFTGLQSMDLTALRPAQIQLIPKIMSEIRAPNLKHIKLTYDALTIFEQSDCKAIGSIESIHLHNYGGGADMVLHLKSFFDLFDSGQIKSLEIGYNPLVVQFIFDHPALSRIEHLTVTGRRDDPSVITVIKSKPLKHLQTIRDLGNKDIDIGDDQLPSLLRFDHARS